MSAIPHISSGMGPAQPSSVANPAAGANPSQAPASASTPTELAGAPGIQNGGMEGFAGSINGSPGQGSGLVELASAFLMALLLSGKDDECDKNSTAKLLLGLAALAALAPQQGGGSISYHLGMEAGSAYADVSGTAPAAGANFDATA